MRYIRITAAFCMALLLAVQSVLTVFAQSETDWLFGCCSVGRDGFFDGLEFGANDWAALCYIRLYGTEGADEYLASVDTAAEQLMQSDGFVKPTELQRAAIVLCAAGRCSEELMAAAVYCNPSLDRQGLNAYIWGLIAANCSGVDAPSDALNTKQSLADYILSKQLQDGGFSLSGSIADADITAAAIYALAPLGASEELTRAEQCLRGLQLESGGYMSIGVESCESAAQAVIAFASLGFGGEDEKVSAALAAMQSYRTEDGYSHTASDKANGMATMQALQALTALELLSCGEMLYAEPPTGSTAEAQPVPPAAPDKPEAPTEPSDRPPSPTGTGLKYAIGAPIILAGAVLAVVLLLRGKRGLLIVPLLICAAGTAVMLLDIKTPEEYYSSSAEGELAVTVTADGTAALEYGTDAAIPENGLLLDSRVVSLTEGSTAFDALIEAAKSERLRVDYGGSAFGEYVTAIGELREFGCGSESGWLYSVNGEFHSVSAGAYTLSDGDMVEFVYTCALGQYQTG